MKGTMHLVKSFPVPVFSVATTFFAMIALLYFPVEGNFLKYWIILLFFQSVRRIFPVLGCNVPGGTGHATIFMLCAFKNNLDPVPFFCH